MHSTIRLGRVAGVEIGVNWSWLVVFGLIVWSLAGGVFPESNPGLSDASYGGMAVGAALLFFASLLLHELGHAVEARRQGVAIDGITLWLFGGVARLGGELPSAPAELRIAAAGPLVTAAIAAVLLLAGWTLPLPAVIDGVVAWLGVINVSLLAFNLLPALPLDGGRIFRALLWQRRGDFLAATRTAAALGRAFGQLLIGGGLLLFFFAGTFGGAWLAFLGWFLLGAAEAEAQSAITRTALGDLRVGQLMVREPVTVASTATVRTFMNEVATPHRFTAYPVVADGAPVGLIALRDVAGVPHAHWDAIEVRDRMQPLADAAVVSEGDRVADALPKLLARRPSRALVLRDGALVGLLSITDIARAVQLRTGTAART